MLCFFFFCIYFFFFLSLLCVQFGKKIMSSGFFSELKIVCAKIFNVFHAQLDYSSIMNSNKIFINQNAIVAQIKMKNKCFPTNASLTITIISHSLFTLFFIYISFFLVQISPLFPLFLFPPFSALHIIFSSQENSFWFHSIVFSLLFLVFTLFFII